MSDFVKTASNAPKGYLAAEAAGLRWLAEPGAAAVVEVLEEGKEELRLARLESTTPTPEAARAFGAALARLHDAGAPGFGWSPADPAFFGPAEDPFPVSTAVEAEFATYWAEERLRPLADKVTRTLGAEGHDTVDEAIDLIADGAFDGVSGQGAEEPARVHGDLWSGNLVWTAEGATLIDPAAHGGHRLEDLAMLSLFDAPHLEEIFEGYTEEHPLPGDWEQDLPAHLLFGLLAHVHLFGEAYVDQTIGTAEAIIARAEELGF
ncbi:fructosamine kinase [Brachybacterium saurashtrense]|uniref:Fructosamine kinase n=2 Tax=Brachybacterium saurashtrense TaxID=556288 RepID=A0A345YRC1_9MICO|nr:fructosamine kinase family protein [Brachybacterium saurashtrense]AXK46473.1 fructosamine kinase [Brachybacterium saurashtrense]RRR24214.1 fructosamine kinase [Brachybacterium saurashtrense]